MGLILLVLLLALLLGGLGFLIHALWIVAVIVAVVWIVGFFMGGAERGRPPNKRPKGDDVGMVFRVDWEEGRALYAAYDRVALRGHLNWVTEHPRTAWNGEQDLTWWVLRIWELLS